MRKATPNPKAKASFAAPAPPVGAQSSFEPADVREAVEAGKMGREAFLALCRRDVNAFNEFVLRDEESGERIEQHEMHVRMQAACDSFSEVVVLAHPESGKTQQLAIGRTLFELGHNPRLRFAFIGNTQNAAKKNLGTVKRYIEKSEELHAVFPELLPGAIWRDDQITIAGFPIESKDYSIQAIGFHGDINGSRVDRVVADDLLDFENTRSPLQRKEVSAWWRLGVLSRLTKIARIIFLTNAWHEKDLVSELSRDGYHFLEFPIYRPDGSPSWPEVWPLARIAKRRQILGPLEFARLFLLKPRDEGAVVFAPAAILRAREKGRGYRLVEELDPALLVRGAVLVHGVDLAFTRRLSGAVSCIFSLFIHPDGTRQPIGIRAGRWGSTQLISALADVGDRLGGIAYVEDNAAQRFVVETAQDTGEQITIPVRPFTTGRNKIDPTFGVESMSAEFDSGRWILPCDRNLVCHPELEELIGEMEAYDPAVHTGDRLMAMWIARSAGMRIWKRMRSGKEEGGGIRASVYG